MIYERYIAGSLILSEGDKSNNKFYVVLSGEVSILIRNSENVFISENLQKKFLHKMSKERLSQPSPNLKLVVEKLNFPVPASPEKNEQSAKAEEKVDNNQSLPNSPEKRNSIKNHNLKKTKTLTPVRKISPPKKKMSLLPDILTSQTLQSIKLPKKEEIAKEKIEEEEDEEIIVPEKKGQYPKVPILPFFHLGKETVLIKLKEMGYNNKELYKGEGFGEVALLDSKARRTASVVALTSVELIVILKKDFLLIRQKFSHEYKAKKKFLVDVLPFLQKISSSSTLDTLIFCFKELRLSHRQKILTEKDKNPEKIYFLAKGKCKIEKSLVFESELIRQSKMIHICDVDVKGIIGEEILFSSNDINTYHYTATVTSEEAFFFTISKNSMLSAFPKEVKIHLYENFLMKESKRNEIFEKFSQNLKEKIQAPEIQPMMDLKIYEKQKIMKNISPNLRLNYYQKLKNNVIEEFLKKGGNKESIKWDPELMCEVIKRSISKKKGVEKLYKLQKHRKDELSLQEPVIRNQETDFDEDYDEKMINYKNFMEASKKFSSIEINEKINEEFGQITFDFGFEGQNNHRLEVFKKAKIGHFEAPKYQIPHHRIFKNLWGKAIKVKERIQKAQEENENAKNLFTITTNDASSTFGEKLSFKEPKEKDKEKRTLTQEKKSRAVKSLKVFLSNFKESNFDGNFKESNFDGNFKRMHSSRAKTDLNNKSSEKFSFSKHLFDVQRMNSSLKKKGFFNTMGSFNRTNSERDSFIMTDLK